jgi:hypothetical protein
MMADWDTPHDLAHRIRAGGTFSDDDREFIADCLERCPPRTAREVTRLRDGLAAEYVTLMQACGIKKEAAVAAAQEKFGMVRSRVFAALKKNSAQCDDLRKLLADARGRPSTAVVTMSA